MMKKGALLLTISTLVFVAFGALLPYGVAHLQDNHLLRQSDMRELSDVKLVLQKDLAMERIFALLSGTYSRIDLDERFLADNATLTAEEAESAAKTIIDALLAEDLISETLFVESTVTTNPFLAVSSEGSNSAVFWECTWTNPNQMSYSVRLEDSTGKMTGFALWGTVTEFFDTKTSTTKIDMKNQDQFYSTANRWAEFCRTYYVLESSTVENASYDGIDGIFTLIMTGISEDVEYQYRLPLFLAENQVYFSM